MAQFQRYRSKPVIIDAVQLTDSNIKEVKKLLGEHNYEEKAYDPVNLHVRTIEGTLLARPGSWIIKGLKGEFYPCDDDVFRMKYEPERQTPDAIRKS